MALIKVQSGADARTGADLAGAPTIEADNCVFHELAMRNPEVCQFDLSHG